MGVSVAPGILERQSGANAPGLPGTAIRIVAADRHPVILHGVESLCAQSGFTVLARCTDGNEALRAIRTVKPDIFITELRLPGRDAVAILRELKRDNSLTRTIILTEKPDEEQVAEAIRLGVRGVVLKDMPSHFLVQCVEKVHAGERWLESRSAGRLLERLLRREVATRQFALQLTPREMDVVRLATTGLSNKAIGEKLFLTEGTVKIHLYNIYRKLNVDSRLALAIYAQRQGLV